MRSRLQAVDPLVWLVIAIATITRLLAWAAGVGVDLSTIGPHANEHAWQLLDLTLLRHDLVSATGSLIMQPPLYNLSVGLLLHLPTGLQAPVAGSCLFVCSVITAVATFSTLMLLGMARSVSFTVTVVMVIADPASILFSSYLFYAAPTAMLVTLMGWSVVRLLRRPSTRRALTVGCIAAALALFNTSYQPVMVLLVLAVLIGALRKMWRPIAVGFALPALVIITWTGAMWIETGAPTTSTWLGMNLAHVTTDASPAPLIRHLVATGTLSPTALVPAFSSLAAYGIEPRTPGPAAQAQVTRSDGQPNFNNPAYETAAARSLHDDLAFIGAEPSRYLASVSQGLRIWLLPSDEYSFLHRADARISSYAAAWDHVVDLQFVWDPYATLAILTHQTLPLDQVAWTEVVLGCTALLGTPLVVLVERRRRRRRAVALLALWFVLAQAFVISSLTEYGENNRFRFETGTLRITLAVVVIATVLDHIRGTSSARAARLDTLGWQDDPHDVPLRSG